jgi:hypothetical protein
MKFQVLGIIPHLKNPVTGEIASTADRLNQVVETARRAEELGYDSFSVGERHAGEFISSSPTTVLAAISAVTSRIPTSLWAHGDPYTGRPEAVRASESDAAASAADHATPRSQHVYAH